MLRILSAWDDTSGSVIESSINAAVETARAGGIIAFPTDTLYGVAVDGRNPVAVQRVFQVKRRPLDKPLPLLVADAAEAPLLSRDDYIAPGARRLMARYWPGALTILLPAKPGLVEGTHGGGKVAVRAPNHPVALALLRAFGGPLATTSANISGEEGARNPEEVAQSIGEGIDLLLVGGPRLREVASTIIDMAVEPPQQVRAGAIPWDDLLAALRSQS
ncbi:MAG TPA: L-threonylcarbamoyladenylate synthase [Ktedonobacterales bacterium]|nr:L-threonylcarbamoyladenylate synthase [Ktedonobacterales bacterium]